MPPSHDPYYESEPVRRPVAEVAPYYEAAPPSPPPRQALDVTPYPPAQQYANGRQATAAICRPKISVVHSSPNFPTYIARPAAQQAPHDEGGAAGDEELVMICADCLVPIMDPGCPDICPVTGKQHH